MNEMSSEEPSYLSCEMNGTHFILQTLTGSEDNAMKITSAEEDEKQFENEEGTIPLVCLDGRIYAYQNGELAELDLSQFMDRSNDTENIVITKDAKKETNDRNVMEYIKEEDGTIDNSLSRDDEYRSAVTNDDANFIMGENTLNANDFVEVVTAFKCKMCPFTTQDRTELLEHFGNIHVKPSMKPQEEAEDETMGNGDVTLVYMCGECSNCFPTIADCREHMIRDHQLTDQAVVEKNMKESSSTYAEQPGLLIGHRGDRTESNGLKRQVKIPKALSTEYMLCKKKPAIEVKEKNVKCAYRGCPYKFSTLEIMQLHANCHTESQHGHVYKCNICRDVKFTKWWPSSLHLWKEHNIDVDLLCCNICKVYKSPSMVKLLTHMKVHSETREFECPECNKCFKQACQLRNHRVMHLDRRASNVPRWYTSKTCEICGKTYADSKCLKNHIQAVHSKLRPYVCNVCGHSSARKAMLQMHLRQHTGEKPYTCNLCEYRTGDHNSLRRHMMRHTGHRPYKCPHCPYSAIQSNSYKNHLTSKHPAMSGLYTCELCPFKTVKKESYLQHVADHEKGLIKAAPQKKVDDNLEVFPGNLAAAQLIYSCLGAFSKDGKTVEANLMSSATSLDGTSQTITIQIPSKDLEGSLPMSENTTKNNSTIEQEDDETMHCFLAIPREEEENIDTGGITIPAEPEGAENVPIDFGNSKEETASGDRMSEPLSEASYLTISGRTALALPLNMVVCVVASGDQCDAVVLS